jgi:hypothetical protein
MYTEEDETAIPSPQRRVLNNDYYNHHPCTSTLFDINTKKGIQLFSSPHINDTSTLPYLATLRKSYRYKRRVPTSSIYTNTAVLHYP